MITPLCSFIGLVSHYSAFLLEMYQLRCLLTCFLKRDVPWNWSSECQFTYDRMKVLPGTESLLTQYNPSMDIIVVSDASNSGIWSVISHIFPNGSKKAIAHTPRP